MAPRRRSDPKKLAADREGIARSLAGFAQTERVQRSRAKAQADADAFKKTGEGTMGEAAKNLFDKAAVRRQNKKYGGPPVTEGSVVTGFKPGDTTT